MKVVLIGLLIMLMNSLGCASAYYYDVIESLHTEIRKDGSKRFVYSIVDSQHTSTARPPKIDNSNGIGEPRKGRLTTPTIVRDTSTQQERILRIFAQFLDETDEIKQYCQQGYIELDRFVDKYQVYLRGECQETATEEEILNFSKNKPRTIS